MSLFNGGGVFGDDLVEFLFDGSGIVCFGAVNEFVDPGVQRVAVGMAAPDDPDLLVAGLGNALAFGDQLLIELLAGTQAGEADWEINRGVSLII